MTATRLLALFTLLALLLGVGRAIAQDGGPGVQGGPGVPDLEGGGAVLAGPGITYQGELRSGGNPHAGLCDFQFSLWGVVAGPPQLGSTQTVPNVNVINGRFTVVLNSGAQFGPRAFDGSARWLGIQVRCPAGGGDYTNLTPRQLLTAAPLALALPGLRTEINPTSPNVIGGHISNTVGVGVVGAAIAGGGVNSVTGNYSAVGGGFDNTAASGAAIVAGGQANTASSCYATVSGGGFNLASGFVSTIGGGGANTASGSHTTIGGGDGNTASGNNGTVGGGTGNTASGPSATVGGGQDNTAGAGGNATVGGGTGNTASGPSATVGGGSGNTASGNSATVGGGSGNTANGLLATVGGGQNNTGSGSYAAVPGGLGNTASGQYSFAAGLNARAIHNGAFVWADSTGTVISSTRANQMLIRASGGVTMYTDSAATTGVRVLPGGGAWASVSDRNLKANFAPVDGRGVLDALMGLPIETWNYKAQDASLRHIGPMAQDFYAAFGVGEDDVTITTIDADGVALAAIQGLYSVVLEKESLLAEQRAEIAALRARQEATDARLAALEAGETAHSETAQRAVSTGGGYGQLLLGLLLGAGMCLSAFALGRRRR